MMRSSKTLALAPLAGALLLAVSLPAAEAKPVRGTQTCDPGKVDHKIGDQMYSCTHCSNSICEEVNGQLTNCGIEHTYKDCTAKASVVNGGLFQTLPSKTMTLDPGLQGTSPQPFVPITRIPGKAAPLAQ
jgi:hypothetical protein